MARPTRLEFADGTSRKFWQVEARGAEMTVTYGRLGTAGQTKVKRFASAAAAAAEAAKLTASKQAAGYRPAMAAAARPAKGSQPVVVSRPRSDTDLLAMWVEGADLWFAQVFAGEEGDEILAGGGSLAQAVAGGGAVERWRFASAAEAGRAAKWVAGQAKRGKLASDASADLAAWAKRIKKERALVPRLEVGKGPVTLTRDTVHPWVYPRPPATSFLSQRTMVPVFSLVGPIDERFGARTGYYVSVCPQALLDPYVDHVWEVVVQDPAKPSSVDAYFEAPGRGFATVHLSLQVEGMDGGARWAVIEHSGDRGSVGWYRTTHHKQRASAEGQFNNQVEALGGRYKRVDRLGPWYAKILADITRHHRVPGQEPATVKLRVAHAAMSQAVAGATSAPSDYLVSYKAARIGGVPHFCQEDWDNAPRNQYGEGTLLPIATLGRGDGPQWSDVINDGDAGSIVCWAAPGEPFGVATFSCG